VPVLKLCLGVGGQRCPHGALTASTRCAYCDAQNRAARNRRRVQSSPYQGASHRRFRKAVVARDRRCLACNAVRDLEAHHIDKHGPDELHNGMTLCKTHHMAYEAAIRGGHLSRQIVSTVHAIAAVIVQSYRR
jgi:hypothetical protein